MDLRQGSSDPFALSDSLNGNSLASFGLRPIALVPSWAPALLPLNDGDQSGSGAVGSGGSGISIGVMESDAHAQFAPMNMAVGGAHALTEADQGNTALMQQHTDALAGVGGHGGSGNVSLGEGAGHVGSGGSGIFVGALGSSNVAIFDPVNVAVAGGPGSSATAHQNNLALFHQGATEVAGIGGDGGNHNMSLAAPATGTMASGSEHPISMIFNGDITTGHGGSGTFIGSMTDINVAIYSPVNIAVASASGTSANATQNNTVVFDQGAVQMAGIGGHGGDFNIGMGLGGSALGGGSSAVFTGHEITGGGGDGHSIGSLVDVNVGYFQPINIAVPALGEATALQIDHVLLDQHATQIAGIGGAGGDHNLLLDHLVQAHA